MNLKPGNCSSCGASIIWAHGVNREPIALDAEPEERVVLHGYLAIATTTYVVHSTTCRNPISIESPISGSTPREKAAGV